MNSVESSEPVELTMIADDSDSTVPEGLEIVMEGALCDGVGAVTTAIEDSVPLNGDVTDDMSARLRAEACMSLNVSMLALFCAIFFSSL